MALANPDEDILRFVQGLGLKNISRIPEDFAQDLTPLMKKAVQERQIGEKGLKFLAYFIAYQHIRQASIMSGYPEKAGRRLLMRKSVRELLTEMRPIMRELLRTTVRDIEERLWEEANLKGKGSSQAGRLSALRLLMDMHNIGVKGQQGDQTDNSVRTGIVLIPTTLTTAEWNQRLLEHKGKNMIDVTPPQAKEPVPAAKTEAQDNVDTKENATNSAVIDV